MTGNRSDPALLAALREHARGASDFELYVLDGWIPLVRECHAAVVREFPSYELFAIKQKYAELAFQAFPTPWVAPEQRTDPSCSPWPDDAFNRLHEVIDEFRARSATICEQCAGVAEWREIDGYETTLCEPCFHRARRSSSR